MIGIKKIVSMTLGQHCLRFISLLPYSISKEGTLFFQKLPFVENINLKNVAKIFF